MKRFLEYQIFKIDHLELKVISVIQLLIFILAIFILLKIMKKSIYHMKRVEKGKKYSIYNLFKYLILVLAFVISLDLLGFNLSLLLAGSAALLVGLGLGLQNLFSDYISGIIILIDSTIKVGDVIEVNGTVSKVQEINLRTTRVITRDDKYIILPNSDLTKNSLINWTLNEVSARFEVSVGVDYSSEVEKVMGLLVEAIKGHPFAAKKPEVFARFNEFSESSLNFTVYFWSDEVFRIEQVKSEMRVKIMESFRANNIKIPFPQRVIHHV